MHPLTKLLLEKSKFDGNDGLDAYITTYLKSRAEWLKDRGCVYRTDEGVDRAFELDEKCCCGEPSTPNIVHRKDNPCYVNTLPSKISDGFHLDGNGAKLKAKINELIDYLLTKEAR